MFPRTRYFQNIYAFVWKLSARYVGIKLLCLPFIDFLFTSPTNYVYFSKALSAIKFSKKRFQFNLGFRSGSIRKKKKVEGHVPAAGLGKLAGKLV